MAVEVARGKKYFPAWNVARWWLSFDAYQRAPARFLTNLDAGLARFAGHDIAVIPLLFNRWLDPVCDFGGVPLDHLVPHHSAWKRTGDLFTALGGEGREPCPVEQVHTAYLTDVVGQHHDDDRILLWDLCNEPLMGGYVDEARSPVRAAELRCLAWSRDVCRSLAATQPLTVGNYTSVAAVALTEPLSDVITFHPYYLWNLGPQRQPMADQARFERHLDACVEIATAAGKDLLATETKSRQRIRPAESEDERVTASRRGSATTSRSIDRRPRNGGRGSESCCLKRLTGHHEPVLELSVSSR